MDVSAVWGFDYGAFGHLHSAQKAGAEAYRYCGTLLKYSVREAEQEKALHLVTLGEKGTSPQVERLKLTPLRDVCRKSGSLSEVLQNPSQREREAYISITLTDEEELYKPKEQLQQVYRRILEVRIENSRTKRKLDGLEEELIIQSPQEVFGDFYREMQGKDLTEEEQKIMDEIFEQAKEEDQ